MTQAQIYSRYFTYIKPITKLPIVRTYGSTIFTLLVTSIFIFFAIKPAVETIVVLQKKLADSKQVLEKVNQKAYNLSAGKANLEKLDPLVKAKIQSAIPDTVNLKSVTLTLEQIAKNHEASISALQIQPLTIDVKTESKPGILSEISFTFNVEGDYRNLVSLLQDIKSTARLLSVNSVSLTKLSEGGGLLMSITGKTFYIK